MLHHKKKFGQHFLRDSAVISDILSLIPEDYNGPILEVGPGGGALTEGLLDYTDSRDLPFLAVEIDEEKVQHLQKIFPEHKDQFLLSDFLDAPAPWDHFLLIGNFPYNISTQILFKMIEWKEKIPLMIGMFQLEVAARICAPHGSKTYGITSVITQTFYDTEIMMTIPAESFDPPPKVNSAVIVCTRQHRYNIQDARRYSKFVKAGFAMRRKTLRNNFKPLLSSEELQNPIFDKRAEQLSVTEWVNLYLQYRHEN